MKKLTARRVRRLRAWIQANRCDVRPGLTHKWEPFEYIADFSQWCPPAEIGWRCTKCGEEEL